MIILLTIGTFSWTFFIFHEPIVWSVVSIVVVVRMLASRLLLQDYSLSWSKSTPKTFLIKSVAYAAAFAIYMPLFYGTVSIALLISELLLYLFILNFAVYAYNYWINKSYIEKTKDVIIYGAGKAGLKLEEEFRDGKYRVRYFIDDNINLQKRSIDSIKIISSKNLKNSLTPNAHYTLLVIAMPSAPKSRVKDIYSDLVPYFDEIKILPSLDDILRDKPFANQLKKLTLRDLLARNAKDLDRQAISEFVKGKNILISGAGGSIGSEIVRQCIGFGASKLVLLDHSEYNLYSIFDEVAESDIPIVPVLQSVTNRDFIEETFGKYKPQIVIHAAAYKHVPMVEENIRESIINNIIGTKNIIDLSIESRVETFLLISTDKAVRPTNVMGTTKRICELYAQNVDAKETSIVAVRFGNVLGSSGSVVPKFQRQIEQNRNITVTDPEITRYFMLIPEACELVLQAASLGRGGEIFILDMGEPVKIAELAQKMIELSGKLDVEIEYIGLRPGEKLYEELLIDESDMHTEYESIMVAAPTPYGINRLNQDIEELLNSERQIDKLREIVPEFTHL
ncbi:MAG: nucleoside-diphosphate sugar epimerase/dehydratase [Campylobacterota bacterium]|nr:nucleoside-diphosphate sugar epimerase/dehydratase [Campylobacterota bacterium]